MEDRTVILYGQSMLVGLVANSLAQTPHLQVIHATSWEHVEEQFLEFDPETLIFDLNPVCQKLALPLLVRHPGLRLIGLDVEHNRAILLSGLEAHDFTMKQIRELVEEN